MEQKRIEETREVATWFKLENNQPSTGRLLKECLSEIERLQKELDDERAAHAMTRQNFEDYAEEMQQALDDKSQAEWNVLSDDEKWRRIKNA